MTSSRVRPSSVRPVAGVGAPDKVAARRVRSVDPDRSVERLGSIGPIGLQRLDDLLDGQAGRLCELRRGRRPVVVRRELARGPPHAYHPVTQVAGHVNAPGRIAQVALQLPPDRRYRVGGEGGAALEVEAVDGLQEADGRHLAQIVELPRSGRVAARELVGQRPVEAHEVLAGESIALHAGRHRSSASGLPVSPSVHLASDRLGAL